jgi:methionyl aminopeptidase
VVKPKTEGELELMKKSGKIAASALKQAIKGSKMGVSASEVDAVAGQEILKLGGDWSYKTVPGYKWATCVNFNEGVVHGIPTDRKIINGDLISVDLAVMYKGWHTDCAWSVLVGEDKTGEARKFLAVGEEALWLGIRQAIEGNTVGDISNAIQTKVEGSGYQVVRSLVGHGVGRALHEDPEVPGYGEKGTGLVLQEGMTLAIEVIYAKGTSKVELAQDGWTYISSDGSISGLFEMTVIVGKKAAGVLTDWRKV